MLALESQCILVVLGGFYLLGSAWYHSPFCTLLYYEDPLRVSSYIFLFCTKTGNYLCCHKASCLEPFSCCSFGATICKETFEIKEQFQKPEGSKIGLTNSYLPYFKYYVKILNFEKQNL